jgi:hypothetical protein
MTDNKPIQSKQDSLSPAEIERLKRDIYRSDMEKFRLFTQMLRTNALLKRAVIRHNYTFAQCLELASTANLDGVIVPSPHQSINT